MLGKPFEEVHRWLDEFAGQPPYGMRHRKLRHHLAGIEQVRKLGTTTLQPVATDSRFPELA